MKKILSFITTGVVLTLGAAMVVSPLASAATQIGRIDIGGLGTHTVYPGGTVDMSGTTFSVNGTPTSYSDFAQKSPFTVVYGVYDQNGVYIPGTTFENNPTGLFTAPTTLGSYYLVFSGSACAWGSSRFITVIDPASYPLPAGIVTTLDDPCAPNGGTNITSRTTGRDFGAYTQVDVIAEISFDANGGTGVMGSADTDTAGDITLPPNTFTRDGYVFAGWGVRPGDSTVVYTDGAAVTGFSGNTTLYAQWKLPTKPADLGAPDTGIGSTMSSAMLIASGAIATITAVGLALLKKRI